MRATRILRIWRLQPILLPTGSGCADPQTCPPADLPARRPARPQTCRPADPPARRPARPQTRPPADLPTCGE